MRKAGAVSRTEGRAKSFTRNNRGPHFDSQTIVNVQSSSRPPAVMM